MYTPFDENIVEKKICRLTGEEFAVTDSDMAFFEKFQIPSPTLCPGELWRNLFAYRNEWNLFPRACSKTGQDMLSCYRPDTIFPVYNHKFWWSDDWSAFDYGRDFDFAQPFFEQYKSLQDVVPRLGNTLFSSENCDYNSHARYSRDCYLSSLFTRSEHIYYSYWTIEGKNVYDSAVSAGCENIYDCLDVSKCSSCVSCQECRDCSDCFFSYQLRNCQNCIACSGLIGKQYYIYNKPSTKEEYEKTLKLLKSSDQVWNQAQTVFEKIRADSSRPASQFTNVENVTGDHLRNCRDCFDCFDGVDCENCRYLINLIGAKDCIWGYSAGHTKAESCAFCCVVTNVYEVRMSHVIFDSKNITYCDSCRNSSDLFGCIGLNHGSYAIMNRAYSQQEYEKLQSKIIDHMKSTGEWGEFFPLKYSPHPYDDTAAQDWYPLSQSEVEQRGGRWGGDTAQNQPTSSEKPLHISQYDERIVGVEIAQKNIDHALKTIFRCPVTGKPFQIIGLELAFHIENGIPLPTTHPRERNRELMKLRNARELHERSCSECGKKIVTTYTPDRPEKILCDECYMKYIY